MHFISVLENIKIYIKNYIKTAPTSLLLHRAFWRFTNYYTPTNAPTIY